MDLAGNHYYKADFRLTCIDAQESCRLSSTSGHVLFQNLKWRSEASDSQPSSFQNIDERKAISERELFAWQRNIATARPVEKISFLFGRKVAAAVVAVTLIYNKNGKL